MSLPSTGKSSGW